MEVAELFAALGFKIDRASWERANAAIEGIGKKLGSVLTRARDWGRSLQGTMVKAAAGYGFGKLVQTGLKFNSTVEEARNQIAGMLALTKKTDLNDQLGTANDLMASLQRRAASLPGTTQEYVQMLSAITQPVVDAGLGLKDLEDITVNSVVAAKALGESWDVAARDIGQALRGQFNATDPFTGKLLGSIGFKGEEGRERFKALNAKQRAEALKRAITQKQLTQLAAAQGATASGKFSTFIDTIQQTLGRVTAPLFAQLVKHLEQVNKWLEANSDKVKAFAATVGGVLVTALEAVIDALAFLAENKEIAIGLGIIAGAFLLIANPIALVIAGIVALMAFLKRHPAVWNLIKNVALAVLGSIKRAILAIVSVPITIGQAFADAWEAVRAGFESAWRWITDKLDALKSGFEWFWNKVKEVKNFIGGSVSIDAARARLAATPGVAPTAPGTAPSIPPPAGAVAQNTNTLTFSPTISVTGSSDPQTAADIVDQKLRQAFADAHDNFRGGRR